MALPQRKPSTLEALTDEIRLTSATAEENGKTLAQHGEILARLDERTKSMVATDSALKTTQNIILGLLVAVALVGGSQVFSQCGGQGNSIQSERPQKVIMERGE